ncbi:MAG: TRAP transporter large permease subunit [Burkholderiaceae bacterium]|nr:TRAP transporter large permease subunit [Burkholderiales bacterium]MCZ8105208.1 TRAP transporter large permease subunit [Burkholderiales bacterium]MCZ8339839.1 TRAP transporter large permease subunit [Burkholderiaceae bacterium]
MSIELVSVLMAGSFVGLLLIGMPLAFAAGAVGVLFALVLYGAPGLTLVVSRVFTLLGNSVLVSVPLFVFMACLLERAGIADDIFRVVAAWASRVPGGLAVAVILTSTLMAAMVGVLGAEIVTIGIVALPAMLSRGYSKDLALGSICAGGGLATLIPPSVVFIMYGLTAGVSIGQLYMAGIVPGLMLASMYIAYIMVRATLNPALAPRALTQEATWPLSRKLGLAKHLVLPGLVVLMVLGSLYFGWATPTEAGGVGVFGAALSMIAKGRMSWDNVRRAVEETTKTTAMLYWLFFGSSALIGVYTLAGGTQMVQSMLTAFPLGPVGLLLVVQLVWIVLGCFIDWIGILLLTAPIFVPVMVKMGFDPVWLGVLFCMNMQISYISPPFGPAAFYLKGVAPPDVTIGDIFRSIWPYLGLQAVALGIVMAFPQIALWLPQTMSR